MSLQHPHDSAFLAVLPVSASAIPLPSQAGMAGGTGDARFMLCLPPVPCAIRFVACHFNLSASP